jgi:hypothetical protein
LRKASSSTRERAEVVVTPGGGFGFFACLVNRGSDIKLV